MIAQALEFRPLLRRNVPAVASEAEGHFELGERAERDVEVASELPSSSLCGSLGNVRHYRERSAASLRCESIEFVFWEGISRVVDGQDELIRPSPGCEPFVGRHSTNM